MPSPSFEWFEGNSTEISGNEISGANPVEFGECRKGSISYPTITVQRTLHLWNDRGGANGSDTATGIQVYVAALDGDPEHPLFVGTDLNGGVSCIEVRSVSSLNCPADSQEEWTAISPDTLLSIGDMPSNSMREIQVRVNVPVDMETIAEESFELMVDYD